MTKRDIENDNDIYEVMSAFYDKLLNDDSIGYLFTNVAKLNLQTHLPHLVHFWSSILFDTNDYAKNVMKIHMDLHQKSPLMDSHFKTWITYFKQTVDELFEGEISQKMKDRASGIAYIMNKKVSAL